MISKKRIPCTHCDGRGFNLKADPASLRKARLASGISLRGFARKLGFSAAYIMDIEYGRRGCTAAIEEAYSELPNQKG